MPAAIKLTTREVFNLVGIGFCQPKFYKRSVWQKAKRLMDDVVCKAGLAHPFDYGRGKGKYSTNHSIEEVKAKTCELLKEQGRLITHDGDYVLVGVEKNDPIVKVGRGFGFESSRTVSITTTAGNALDVPVFDKQHEVGNDKVKWVQYDDFICHRLITDIA